MELKVLEETKDKFIVEVVSEDATICNLLRKELWNDDKVKSAAFAVKNPNINNPYIIVETSGKKPRDALLDAIKRIKKDLSEVEKKVSKEL